MVTVYSPPVRLTLCGKYMKDSQKTKATEVEDDIFNLPPQEIFDKVGNDWHFWLSKTDALLSASELLNINCGNPPKLTDEPRDRDYKKAWDYIKIHMVVRMLRGMAVECLLKAIWLKKGGTLAHKGNYRTIPGTKDHDLYLLATKVSESTALGLTVEEMKILSRLSYAITSGRYPIQKSVTGRKPSTPKMDGRIRWHKWEIPKDDEMFESIVGKLMSSFDGE